MVFIEGGVAALKTFFMGVEDEVYKKNYERFDLEVGQLCLLKGNTLTLATWWRQFMDGECP